MPISLNCVTEEYLNKLDGGGIDPVLYKGDEIKFIYNKLNLGIGKLYILGKRIIWIPNKDENNKKEKIIDFKDITTNNVYLNHYEKNKSFYIHILNELNSISIDSSTIALHAITSDKKIWDKPCVYIQLDTEIDDTDKDEDEMNVYTKYKKTSENEDSEDLEINDSDNDEMFNHDPIAPEIYLVGKNNLINDTIFKQMSNMDNTFNGDQSEDGEWDENEEEEEEKYENEKEEKDEKDDEVNKPCEDV
ncbi:conserved Plasmodium protein, unknown function [Plasmodium berghei]|uniref:Voldacs domain-containing protein n=1 Tax=Plasmodium berghei TaxID=5821 RepID=A0A113SPZ0_PLABE|nr:conserved Plasmodium protein, unknown function [Plasmodium berghei]SCM18556.1 conserved Plasmodium protein, unknown function [Plasmodium berghei]